MYHAPEKKSKLSFSECKGTQLLLICKHFSRNLCNLFVKYNISCQYVHSNKSKYSMEYLVVTN